MTASSLHLMVSGSERDEIVAETSERVEMSVVMKVVR